eukprot:gnl/MRDRNA2_/MRDRNA2_105335_c0_seq1.p1 gnl/MRDRNA2_/MRDRNA2_105335_c0~~gnl/MRDRNA2_/MRDRNA2_105335_c0_seq1.p1  ORF type:complete len:249 (-),score=46.61 gnl/MRDRNA2_/MRDRNA2_105335_c0_seq1:270-1016(-)
MSVVKAEKLYTHTETVAPNASIRGAGRGDGEMPTGPSHPGIVDFLTARFEEIFDAEEHRWATLELLFFSATVVLFLVVFAIYTRSRKGKKEKTEADQLEVEQTRLKNICLRHDPDNGQYCPHIPPHGNCFREHLDTTVQEHLDLLEKARILFIEKKRENQQIRANADRLASLRTQKSQQQDVAEVDKLWGTLRRTERRQLLKESKLCEGKDQGRDSGLQNMVQEAGMDRLREVLNQQRLAQQAAEDKA